MRPRATHACEHRPLVPRPAPDRLQRVAVAEQRGDQAEQQERQVIALPAPFPRVGDRGKGRRQRAQPLVAKQRGALLCREVGEEGWDGRILHGEGLRGVLRLAQHLYRSTKWPSPFLTDLSQTLVAALNPALGPRGFKSADDGRNDV